MAARADVSEGTTMGEILWSHTATAVLMYPNTCSRNTNAISVSCRHQSWAWL